MWAAANACKMPVFFFVAFAPQEILLWQSFEESLYMIELCRGIEKEFWSRSCCGSHILAILREAESDIFMEILVVFVNPKYLRNILVLDVKTCNPGF